MSPVRSFTYMQPSCKAAVSPVRKNPSTVNAACALRYRRTRRDRAPQAARTPPHPGRRCARVPVEQLHAAGELVGHEAVGDLAGRFGHAVACEHANSQAQGAIDRLRVQRGPAEQHAAIHRQARRARVGAATRGLATRRSRRANRRRIATRQTARRARSAARGLRHAIPLPPRACPAASYRPPRCASRVGPRRRAARARHRSARRRARGTRAKTARTST